MVTVWWVIFKAEIFTGEASLNFEELKFRNIIINLKIAMFEESLAISSKA